MKFNVTTTTADELIKWAKLPNLNTFFSLEFLGILEDESMVEVISNTKGSRDKKIEYCITKNLSSQDVFLKSYLLKIYHQVLFCRDNRRFFLLKYDDNFFVDKRWARVIDLFK